MSILNASLIDDRRAVLMAVNSELFDRGRSPHTTKLWFLPHARCAVAGRCHAGFLASIGVGTINAFTVDQTDQIADMLARVYAAVKAQPGVEIDGHQELVFCGWSPALTRMRVITFSRTAEGVFAGLDVPGAHVAPWEPDMGPAPYADTESAMIHLCGVQSSVLRSRCREEGAGGGELYVGILTEDCWNVRIVGRWNT